VAAVALIALALAHARTQDFEAPEHSLPDMSYDCEDAETWPPPARHWEDAPVGRWSDRAGTAQYESDDREVLRGDVEMDGRDVFDDGEGGPESDSARLRHPDELQERILFEKDGLYHRITVTECGNTRTLRFRTSGSDHDESILNLADPLAFELDYYSLMFAAFAHVPRPRSMLFIGLGAGTLPMAMHHYFPGLTIETVDIDPDVIHAAKRFFGFFEDERMTAVARDGRVRVRELLRQKREYDIIIVDAFRGGYIPYHLTTREFMRQLIGILSPDGVVAFNLRSGFKSYAYQRRTIASMFAEIWRYGTSAVVVVASIRGEPPSMARLRRTADELQRRKGFSFNLPAIVRQGVENPRDIRAGPLLTDDYAPVDVLRSIPD
jgi:spermidine synthase